MTQLAERSCKACRGESAPLSDDTVQDYLKQLSDWTLDDNGHLTRSYKFDDFAATLEFVNRVGELAEQEGHHPNIHFTYGKATIELYTHKVDGLTESDFILAAKIGELS